MPSDRLYEEALARAQARVEEVLERRLGRRAPSFSIVMRLDYDDKGLVRLLIDLEASRPGLGDLGGVVEEAIRAGAEEFERVVQGEGLRGQEGAEGG